MTKTAHHGSSEAWPIEYKLNLAEPTPFQCLHHSGDPLEHLGNRFGNVSEF